MKGRGVIAKKYFTRREFVCEYAGEVIDMKEAKKREEEYGHASAGCYLYYITHKSTKLW